MKCGECLHHKRGPAVYDKKCKDLGVQSFASACDDFTPDTYKLVTVQEDAIEQIAIIAKDLKPSQLRILAYLFKYAATVQKTGYKFGQPIFMNLSAPRISYLDCWFQGRVIGATKDLKYLHVASSLRSKRYRKKLVFLTLPIASVLSKSRFTALSERLTEEGKIQTPKDLRSHLLTKKRMPVIRKKSDLDSYEAPTIDACTSDLESLAQGKKPKKKRGSRSRRDTMKVRDHETGATVSIEFDEK